MRIYLIPNVLAEETAHFLPPYVSEILPQIQYFLVENERTARRFIGSLNLGMPIRELTLFVLDKKTKTPQIQQYFEKIPKGSSVGIISEAGVPCVADPGHLAVAYAHEKNWEVMPITGPSSILLALMGSGMNGQKFKFHGYLPIQAGDVAKAIRQVESAALLGETQIFMETPYRNNKLFEQLLQFGHKNTRLCIACNLTSAEQFIRTKPIGQWKTSDIDLHKKPTMFLLGQ